MEEDEFLSLAVLFMGEREKELKEAAAGGDDTANQLLVYYKLLCKRPKGVFIRARCKQLFNLYTQRSGGVSGEENRDD